MLPKNIELKVPKGYTTKFDNTGDCIECCFLSDDLECLHPDTAADCGCQDYDIVFTKEY